jgi:hypothetical protein
MTRNIQSAWLLAAGALFIVTVPGRAQEPATSANQPVAGPAVPTSVTDEDIKMLRADIRAERKQVVAANMTLTPDEATRFWPLFDEYTAEVRKINDRRWAMMKDYASHSGNMTDAQAKEHMTVSAAVDADLIALRGKYLPKFDQVLSPKKTVQFYQIDRRLDLLMNLQLASLIPLIEPTN